MLSKLLGKKTDSLDQSDSEIKRRISKMDLNDMRNYVNNKIADFQICDDGLIEIMKRLLSVNEKTSYRFIEIDAMDVKVKKAFDLVILVAKSKKITVVTIELIQEFINFYVDIIEKFDTDNKQTYASKLKKSLSEAVLMISSMSELKERLDYLDSTR